VRRGQVGIDFLPQAGRSTPGGIAINAGGRPDALTNEKPSREDRHDQQKRHQGSAFSIQLIGSVPDMFKG
jgi:hypothetical protein